MISARIRVNDAYDVVIGSNLLQNIDVHLKEVAGAADILRVMVVTDDNVDRLYGAVVCEALQKAGYDVHKYVIANGERSKNVNTLNALLGKMASVGFTRGDTVIALGGGVVGDIAGLAASLFMRGIGFVQLPTTLISATDSSVGGKCAVNFQGKKNLVGAFYRPKLVLCDTDTLKTLPKRELNAGMAEVIKYGCIADRSFFEYLESGKNDTEHIIKRCCEIKRDFVDNDEHDVGVRHLLNFGHTCGHALEAATDNEFSHGEAVAVGMCVASRIGEKSGLTECGTSNRIADLLRKHGLESKIPDYFAQKCAEYLTADKKARGTAIDAVLLRRIGEGFVYTIDLAEFAKKMVEA